VPDDLTFEFDPVLRLSETASVRYETIGLAIVLFIGLLLLAWRASRVPGLRIDDLVFIVVGSVPGAIFGGRLGYVLDHLEFYRANPNAILDPAQGGLSLTLAVPFGLLTGTAIAYLLGAPAGRWLHAAALPLLFVLAAGKLVGVLGGSGQGMPTDSEWAVSFVGPGPWGSLGADVPSHPSQVYEAIAVGLAIVVLGLLSWLPALRRGNGTALFAGLGLWAIARFAVATTWRDPATIGGLRVEQLLLLAVLIVAMTGFVLRARAPEPIAEPATAEVEVQPA
jgi:phosphatidylglycerol---prolipoprotein diacylglyceryl transferase